MDVREKLVELLKTLPTRNGYTDLEDIADHLIANGVTAQEDCKDCAEATQNCIVMLLESMGKPEFEFPRNIAKKYGIAGRTLVDNVKRLMESGFIKVIASGKSTREPSRYSFSSAWKELPGNQ